MYGPVERLRGGVPIRYLQRGWKVERWAGGGDGYSGSGHSESTSLRFAWKHAPRCRRHPRHRPPTGLFVLAVVYFCVGLLETAHGRGGDASAFAACGVVCLYMREHWSAA